MKFFHIADTHLGAIPDAGFAWSEERRSEIWESFRSVVAKADREEVDLLLIAGDLFHRQPLMRELKEVNYLFSTLKKTKVVFIIAMIYSDDFCVFEFSHKKYLRFRID